MTDLIARAPQTREELLQISGSVDSFVEKVEAMPSKGEEVFRDYVAIGQKITYI